MEFSNEGNVLPNIGPLEIAIVVAIALVIFGPKKIPELGRSAGQTFREFKGAMAGENKDSGKATATAEEVPAAASATVSNAATAGTSRVPDDQA
ncbi:MAG TPA: twin-arginine translocase TatA/TatE family subunit [Solirubrobacterales bacterium]|nr:twin-arginine translocase TatA/TatE family subunit [Solirubrobacterales bacterium]